MDFDDNTRRFKPRRRKRVPIDAEKERLLNRYVEAPEDFEGQIFRLIDKSGTGNISAQDIREFLESSEADTKVVDYADMISEADLDGDGIVSLKDFAQYLRLMQRKDKEEQRQKVRELDGKTRRFLLVARLQGKLNRPIELDPRFIKQKTRK